MNLDFLRSLLDRAAAELGPLTPADHLRIMHALQAPGAWDRARLKRTLRALLARSPEASKQFDALFDQHCLEDAFLPPESDQDLQALRRTLQQTSWDDITQLIRRAAPPPFNVKPPITRPPGLPGGYHPARNHKPHTERDSTSAAPADSRKKPGLRGMLTWVQKGMPWIHAHLPLKHRVIGYLTWGWVVVTLGLLALYPWIPDPSDKAPDPPATQTVTVSPPPSPPPPTPVPENPSTLQLPKITVQSRQVFVRDWPTSLKWTGLIATTTTAGFVSLILYWALALIPPRAIPFPPGTRLRPFRLREPERMDGWSSTPVLDRLADSLGHIVTSEKDHMLDADASVTATAEAGGVPHLHFERRVAYRRVLLLLTREIPAWHPLPAQLSLGLQERRVSVETAVPEPNWSGFVRRNRLEPFSALEPSRAELVVLVVGRLEHLAATGHVEKMLSVLAGGAVAFIQVGGDQHWPNAPVERLIRASAPVVTGDDLGMARLSDALGGSLRWVNDARQRVRAPRLTRGIDALGSSWIWAAAGAFWQPLPLWLALWLHAELGRQRTTGSRLPPKAAWARVVAQLGLRWTPEGFVYPPGLREALLQRLRLVAPELEAVIIQRLVALMELESPADDAPDREAFDAQRVLFELVLQQRQGADPLASRDVEQTLRRIVAEGVPRMLKRELGVLGFQFGERTPQSWWRLGQEVRRSIEQHNLLASISSGVLRPVTLSRRPLAVAGLLVASLWVVVLVDGWRALREHAGQLTFTLKPEAAQRLREKGAWAGIQFWDSSEERMGKLRALVPPGLPSAPASAESVTVFPGIHRFPLLSMIAFWVLDLKLDTWRTLKHASFHSPGGRTDTKLSSVTFGEQLNFLLDVQMQTFPCQEPSENLPLEGARMLALRCIPTGESRRTHPLLALAPPLLVSRALLIGAEDLEPSSGMYRLAGALLESGAIDLAWLISPGSVEITSVLQASTEQLLLDVDIPKENVQLLVFIEDSLIREPDLSHLGLNQWGAHLLLVSPSHRKLTNVEPIRSVLATSASGGGEIVERKIDTLSDWAEQAKSEGWVASASDSGALAWVRYKESPPSDPGADTRPVVAVNATPSSGTRGDASRSELQGPRPDTPTPRATEPPVTPTARTVAVVLPPSKEGYQAGVQTTTTYYSQEGGQVKMEKKFEATTSVRVLEYIHQNGGQFMMGREDGSEAERPAHLVKISPFEMLKTEVTVAQYRECVEAGSCAEPAGSQVDSACTWDQDGGADLPINCVTWRQAQAFARWWGAELPTEAQWEFAARGTSGRAFPWGDGTPASCSTAVYLGPGRGCGFQAPKPVCSRLSGRTPAGICDLAGNVAEWVSDLYSSTYYSNSRDTDPRGPLNPLLNERVLRGGSWQSAEGFLLTTRRDHAKEGTVSPRIGFRLVRNFDSGR